MKQVHKLLLLALVAFSIAKGALDRTERDAVADILCQCPDDICNLTIYGSICINASICNISGGYCRDCTEANPQHLRKLEIFDSSVLKEGADLSKLFKLQELTKFTATGYSGTTIPDGVFSTSKLTTLALTNGNLNSVDGIHRLTNLAELNLMNNKITAITIEGTNKAPELTNLNLNRNKITEIEWIKQMPKLNKLDLSNNNITALPVLNNQMDITEFNLGSNLITNLDDNFTLYLKGNSLIIDLGRNYINSLPNVFGNNFKYSSFKINNNLLTTLPNTFVAIAESVGTIDIKENYLDCSGYTSDKMKSACTNQIVCSSYTTETECGKKDLCYYDNGDKACKLIDKCVRFETIKPSNVQVKCAKCEFGYKLVSDPRPHCVACVAETEYNSVDGVECKKCEDTCKFCNMHGECIECEYQKNYLRGKICEPCSDECVNSNCEPKTGVCTRCKKDYYINTTSRGCTKCPGENETSDGTAVNKCNNATDDTSDIPDCLKYDSGGKCLRCIPGKEPSGDGLSCNPCPGNTTWSNGTKCTACICGYCNQTTGKCSYTVYFYFSESLESSVNITEIEGTVKSLVNVSERFDLVIRKDSNAIFVSFDSEEYNKKFIDALKALDKIPGVLGEADKWFSDPEKFQEYYDENHGKEKPGHAVAGLGTAQAILLLAASFLLATTVH